MNEISVPKKTAGSLGETVRVVIEALLIAFVVRTFLFQPFNIPSGSMKSTLLVGDYLFVSKFSYGWSKYSLPWAMIPFSGRIFGSEPARGDVVVFRAPHTTIDEPPLIKRLVGLPGDRIRMRAGRLVVNGEAVALTPRGPGVDHDPRFGDAPVRVFDETLPGGVTHAVLSRTDRGFPAETPEYVVPAGHYFMMGDNRDNSRDSRFLDEVGYIPAENLIGKAQMIFFSFDEEASPWNVPGWPAAIRWDRLFRRL